MRGKAILAGLFIILVVFLLGAYWFIPHQDLDFFFVDKNSNFTIGNVSEGMQFYPNMRFPSTEISYHINKCTLQKKSEMERAFDTIENVTELTFIKVPDNGQIEVTCDSNTKLEGGLYVAGEGGPSNITKSGEFNVIKQGKILLIRESKCDKPLVSTHELLHVLGFNHSQNEENIMFPVSKCGQEIGKDTLDLIDKLYSYPSYPDLAFESASASRSGTYLDLNFSVRNMGLEKAKKFVIVIYADNSEIDRYDSEALDIGEGRKILLSNIFSLKRDINQLKLEIEYPESELKKENNLAVLEIKNK